MNKATLFIIYVISAISFYLMNIYTPFNGDDYGYAFIIGNQNFSQIKTFGDVITSQYNHYFLANGRIIPHVLEQTFMGIFGKDAFNLLNTIIYLFLISLIYHILNKDLSNRQSIILLLIICISSLYCFSYPGQTELWMDGSFNYMWPTFLSLIIVYVFQKKQNYTIFQNILLFLFAIIASCTHEGIVIPITGSLLFFLLFFKKFRHPTNYIITIGYTLGTLVVSLSPGILQRLSTNELPTHGDPIWIIVSRLLNSITALNNVYIFWFTGLLVFLYLSNKALRYKLLQNIFWFILWLFNTIFIFILGFGEERVTYTLSIFSFILTYKLLQNHLYRINNTVLVTTFSLLFIIGNIHAIKACKHYHLYYSKYTHAIHENSDKEITINMNPYKHHSRFIFIDDIYDYKIYRNLYYQKENVTVLDNSSYSLFNSSIETFPIIASTESYNLYYDSMNNTHFIITETNINPQEITLIEKHPINNDNLKKHQLFIRTILNSLDTGINVIKFTHFHKNGTNVLNFRLPLNSKELYLNLDSSSYKFQL